MSRIRLIASTEKINNDTIKLVYPIKDIIPSSYSVDRFNSITGSNNFAGIEIYDKYTNSIDRK